MWPLCNANCALWLLLPLLLGLLAGWWAWGRRPKGSIDGVSGDVSGGVPGNLSSEINVPAANRFGDVKASADVVSGDVSASGSAALADASIAGGVASAAVVGGAAVALASSNDGEAEVDTKAGEAPAKTAKATKAPVAAKKPAKASKALSAVGAAGAGAVALTAIGIPAAVGDPDDLLKIKGIGPKLNGVLNGLGVFRFDQIAKWKAADVDKVDDHIGAFKGRIGDEEWIPQAKLLAAGKIAAWESKYGTVKKAAAAGGAVALLAIGIPAAIGAADDLLQIKGVGPKLNKLLVGLGVTRFDQIAAWGAAEIDKVDDHLGTFKSRITRDSWVEQAKLLAKGKIKEFEAKFGKLDSENK